MYTHNHKENKEASQERKAKACQLSGNIKGIGKFISSRPRNYYSCTCHFILNEETSRLTGSLRSTMIFTAGSSCAARSGAFG